MDTTKTWDKRRSRPHSTIIMHVTNYFLWNFWLAIQSVYAKLKGIRLPANRAKTYFNWLRDCMFWVVNIGWQDSWSQPRWISKHVVVYRSRLNPAGRCRVRYFQNYSLPLTVEEYLFELCSWSFCFISCKKLFSNSWKVFVCMISAWR